MEAWSTMVNGNGKSRSTGVVNCTTGWTNADGNNQPNEGKLMGKGTAIWNSI
jgi:hypothetical protein